MKNIYQLILHIIDAIARYMLSGYCGNRKLLSTKLHHVTPWINHICYYNQNLVSDLYGSKLGQLDSN